MLKRAAFLLCVCLAGPAAAAPQKLVVTAAKDDPALAFAQLLCTLVNQQKRLDIACEARDSGGAVDGLQGLDGEEVHITVARADWVQQAYAGTGPFRDKGPVRGTGRQRRGGANEDLRVLFDLQIETFVVLARADSGIKTLADLKGKRLNVGPPGSGGRVVYETLAPALGWQLREFEIAAELGPSLEGEALCRNRIDAVFYLAAHPNASLRDAMQVCDTVLVPVTGREVEALDKEKSFLLKAGIPGGIYKGAAREIPSLGIPVVAVASSKVDAKLIHDWLKVLFDHLVQLRRSDPVFARLDPRRMTGNRPVAPLHEGAMRLYKERGWIR